MISRVQRTDGGRANDGFNHETNDCGVRALALSCNISYAQAHSVAASVGRKDRKGMHSSQILPALSEAARLNFIESVQEIPFPKAIHQFRTSYLTGRIRRRMHGGITVAQFLRRLPAVGTFYVCCNRHAFTVKNGVVLDNASRVLARAKMVVAYEIKPRSKVVPVSDMVQSEINAAWERLNQVERNMK